MIHEEPCKVFLKHCAWNWLLKNTGKDIQSFVKRK